MVKNFSMIVMLLIALLIISVAYLTEDKVTESGVQLEEATSQVKPVEEKEPESVLKRAKVTDYDYNIQIRGVKDGSKPSASVGSLTMQGDYKDTYEIIGLWVEYENGEESLLDESDINLEHYKTDDSLYLTSDNISLKIGDVIEIYE